MDVGNVARRLLRRQSSRQRMSSVTTGRDEASEPWAPGFSAGNLHRREAGRLKPVLTDPERHPTRDLGLAEFEFVIGVRDGTVASAYPTDALAIHHIVNDVVDSPLLVTFCSRCFSAVCFDPVVGGQRLIFRSEGLYDGNMAMRDTQTSTLWNQMSGEAMAGELAGTRLLMRPSSLVTVGEWLKLYPKSESPARRLLRTAPQRRLPGHFAAGAADLVSHRDDRLEPDTFVLGVDVPGAPIAFILDSRNPGPRLFQAEVADVPVALIAPPGGWPVAFDRRIGGETIDLNAADDGHLSGNGSEWNHEGVATDGPHKGRALAFIPSRTVHWFAWVTAHPQTQIQHVESA